MQLRKNTGFPFQVHPLFIALPVVIFCLARAHNGTTASAPPAVISGRVIKYPGSGSVQGLAGIQITAYNPVGITPIEQTVTDSKGYYTLNLNLSGWQEIYLCAQDPGNLYVSECYEEHYWLYSETGQWGDGNKIGIAPNQKITRDFALCQGGSIPVTVDLPHNHGFVLYLDGTINYKAKTSMVFPPENPPWKGIFSDPNTTHYSLDLADYILKPDAKVPLPSGNYTLRVEDYAQFFYDFEITTPYLTYSINPISCFLPKSSTVVISCDKPRAEPVHFDSFGRAGMIFGIITDPNTREVTSHIFYVQSVQEGQSGQSDLDIGRDPNRRDPANPQITYFTQADGSDQGIKGIQVEIVPVNNQPISRSVIPAKVMNVPDPDANQPVVFHTGKYGGYAFKFLKPGGYKVRAFSRIGSVDIFSVFYGQNATSTKEEIISLGEGESKQINFTLAETSISGKVAVQGGNLPKIAILLTKNHEHINSASINPTTGEFSFHQLLSGEVILRIAKDGYSVVEQTLTNLKLGENRNVGTITLTPFIPGQGTGKIHGRIYLDEDPQKGLANITVRALDIKHLRDVGQIPSSAITDTAGNFTISNLPNSEFIVYTVYDPNKVTGGYFNEMYDNVIAFKQAENWCQWETNRLTSVLQNIDSSHMDDPNILITPVSITGGEDREVNIGLSNHQYPFPAGMNLFAYPGTPLKACDTATEFLVLFPREPHSQTSIGTGGIGRKTLYIDPNSNSFQGNDFAIETGRGYILYLDKEVSNLRIPPFTIAPPPTINLDSGRNIISVPDGPDKHLCAQDVIITFGGNKQDARLNSTALSHFDPREGKWRSTTWLWGRCAGDNFKIERTRGYLADMKKAISWSRGKRTTP
ncbi:MAG: hypothetical protein AB1611_21850 [bacterium]